MRDPSTQIGLIEAMPDAMLLLDGNACIQYLNRAASDVLGVCGKTCLGWSIEQILKKLRLERGEPIVWRGAPGLMVVPQKGRLRYYEVSIAPFSSPDLGTIEQVVVMRDVTERQEAQKALADQEAFLRSVFEGIEQPVFVVDVTEHGQFYVVRSNAAVRLLNASDDERPTTGTLTACFSDAVAVQLAHQCRTCVAEQQSVEQAFACKEAEETQWWSVSLHPLHNPGGRVYRMVGTAANITQRKAYEAGLEQAKEVAEGVAEVKSSILANMSHEIRTPLTGIIGFASILAEEVSEEHREFAELISNSGRRLLNTLNSVLDYAKLENGKLEAKLQIIDVVETVADTAYFFMRQAQFKGLELDIDLPADSLRARLDPALLDRIVTNLVSNAIKFTDEGGITVRVKTTDTDFILSVTDTGRGMHPHFLPKLFDAFSQESKGLTRSHQGSGLGLMITKQMVEVMNGSISVTSELGQGSTFYVQFPQHAQDKQDSPGTLITSDYSIAKHAA